MSRETYGLCVIFGLFIAVIVNQTIGLGISAAMP